MPTETQSNVDISKSSIGNQEKLQINNLLKFLTIPSIIVGLGITLVSLHLIGPLLKINITKISKIQPSQEVTSVFLLFFLFAMIIGLALLIGSGLIIFNKKTGIIILLVGKIILLNFCFAFSIYFFIILKKYSTNNSLGTFFAAAGLLGFAIIFLVVTLYYLFTILLFLREIQIKFLSINLKFTNYFSSFMMFLTFIAINYIIIFLIGIAIVKYTTGYDIGLDIQYISRIDFRRFLY